MRCAGLLVVVAGCGFHGGASLPDQLPTDADTADTAATVADAGAASDATPSAFCSVPGTVVCFEFEGTADDGSVHALSAAVSGVSFPRGLVGMAMQVGAQSTATLPGSRLFDLDAVTIEAWIRPTQLPSAGKQFDILDVDQQYALLVNDNGTVTCDLHGGPGKFTTNAAIGVAIWTHVACTYDGITTPHLYLNGVSAGTGTDQGTIDHGGHAMGIAQNFPSGSQLVGLIDQLRLLDVERSAGDLCSDAGQAICISARR